MRATIGILLVFAFASAPLAAQQNVDAKKLFNEGNRSLNAGNFEQAIGRYNEALKLERHEFFLYQKGIALRRARRESDAVLAFQEAVKINPSFAPAYNALGTGYSALKDYDKSIVAYDKALELNPKLEPARKGLAAAQTRKAHALIDSGAYAIALLLAEKAVGNDSGMYQPWLIIARASTKLGRTDNALRAAARAMRLGKHAARAAAQYEIGLAQRDAGNAAQAREAFEAALADPALAKSAARELQRLDSLNTTPPATPK